MRLFPFFVGKWLVCGRLVPCAVQPAMPVRIDPARLDLTVEDHPAFAGRIRALSSSDPRRKLAHSRLVAKAQAQGHPLLGCIDHQYLMLSLAIERKPSPGLAQDFRQLWPIPT